MSARVLLVALAVVASAEAGAQEVTLGGWALPEGAVVTGVGRMEWDATFRPPGEVDPSLRYRAANEDSTVTTVRAVEGGRLMAAHQLVARSDGRAEVLLRGQTIHEEERPDALEGVVTRVARAGDGWSRTYFEGTPDAAETAALAGHVSLDDAEYPARPVRVGEAWDVDSAAVAAIYGDLAAGHTPRLTVRLDSVGTFEGGPAAFVTQDVEVVVRQGEGETFAMRMRGRIVRRLDLLIDVLTMWEGNARVDARTPGGPLVIEGTMRRGDRQAVRLPEAGVAP